MQANSNPWRAGRFNPNPAALARVRAFIDAQETEGRKHPGLWAPAGEGLALRIEPSRSLTPTLDLRLVSTNDKKRTLAGWAWTLADNVLRPIRVGFASSFDGKKAERAARRGGDDNAILHDAIIVRNAILRGALARLVDDDRPFVARIVSAQASA